MFIGKLRRGPNRVKPFLILLILCIVLIPLLIFTWHTVYDHYHKIRYPQKYQELVTKYAAQNNLDDNLVYSVIKCESDFQPDAVSSIGARGLMQITEETFHWLLTKIPRSKTENISFDALFDPETNIRFGTLLLSILQTEFGDRDTVLCAYHAGWGSVKRWLKNTDYSPDGKTIDKIPYSDTNTYVSRINKVYKIYNTYYPPGGSS